MSDPFRSEVTTGLGAALGGYAIAPSDTADLPQAVRAVTVNVEGVLSFISSRDGAHYTTGILPRGTYPIFIARVLSTGTTASGLTGWV